jgi:DNA invertase Pin-like site-specific DNA recombinase
LIPSQSPSSPNPARALRCATLVRVSTQEQAGSDRAGLDRQRQAVARVVADKRYEVVSAIELIDVSGTSILHAAEVIELINRIENREIDVLLASEMSRIIRPDDLSSFGFLETCRRHGVVVDLGGTVHDFDSPEGFLSGGILALLGGHERMQMLRRMMASKEAKRARGEHPQSRITLPLGIEYDREAAKFGYNERIVSVIEAFRLVDEEGIRNLSEVGRRCGIHQRNVVYILRNEIYRGERVYSKFRDQSRKGIKASGRQGDRPKIARPPERVIRVRVFTAEEQAVSDERFERVQQVLRGIRENHEVFVAERHEGNLLSGVGRCGFCAERLYAKRRSRRLADNSSTKGHYICRSAHESAKGKLGHGTCKQGWVRKEELDELTEAFVTRFLADPDFMKAVLHQAREKQAGKVLRMDIGASVKDRLADLERRDKRVLEAMEEGLLSIPEAKQRRQRLADERAGLIKAQQADRGDQPEDRELEGIAGAVSKGLEGWPAEGTVKKKKAFLAKIFSEIYFQRGAITAFRLSPGLIGSTAGVWSFAADMPVAIDPPVCLKVPEPEVVVPDGMKRCSRCREIKSVTDFYGKLAACKRCTNKASAARYRKKRAERG